MLNEPQPSDPNSDVFLSYLSEIGNEDAAGLVEAQKQYGNSWKKRGGIGVFMMLARKWDRFEQRVQEAPRFSHGEEIDPLPDGDRFDILAHLAADDRVEGLIDDIRDLRRYLTLVEAEARAMGLPCAQSKHRDNKS